MKWRRIIVACCVAGLLSSGGVLADDGANAASTDPEQTLEVTSADPVSPAPLTPNVPKQKSDAKPGENLITGWWSAGLDLRIREVFYQNVLDFEDDEDVFAIADKRHFWRGRLRLWSSFGPFFVNDAADKPNGLKAYVRLTGEPRWYMDGMSTEWREIVWDNLYLDWQRIAGVPVSLKIGRQDLRYGRDFVIVDGTPLDGSRTMYSDGVKLTLHLDDVQSNLDLFWLDNKGTEDRLRPIDDDGSLVNQYDARLFGAYLVSKPLKDQEFHAYYIYKDEDPVPGVTLPGRIVHTVGGLAQGKFCDNWDYYAESAYQWGRECQSAAPAQDRNAWGLSTDLGYTFADCPRKPRLHVGYMFLSGDDPDTGDFEGWDPVLSRWPQWSETMAYRGVFDEMGQYGVVANLQRFTAGVGAQLCEKVGTKLDYSYVLADEHPSGETFPYDSGGVRGHLLRWDLKFQFNPRVSGHVALEYFQPGNYYDDSLDKAVFARWQMNFTY